MFRLGVLCMQCGLRLHIEETGYGMDVYTVKF